MRSLLVLLLCLLCSPAEDARAVPCAETNYVLSAQAEVDALGATGCDWVLGNLSIENTTNIQNLDALQSLVGIGLHYSNPSQVSVAYNNVCLLDDYGVRCWGANSSVTTVPELTNPVAVEVGWDHACAIDDTGVICWGNNNYGQTDVPARSNPRQVVVGGNNTCVLDDSGVVCWGRTTYGVTNVPTLVNPRSVALSSDVACAVDDTGIVCWGNDYYILNNIPNLANPAQVALYNSEACAISDTAVRCWGAYLRSTPLVVNPTSVSVSYNFACVTDDTGLVCWDRNLNSNLGQPKLPNISKVSVGGATGCSIADADLLCWGDNTYNQIGGGLTIRNAQGLSHLDGLINLTFVGGDIWLDSNDSMRDIDGLLGLDKVTGSLRLQSLSALNHVDGLSGLGFIGGGLEISSNESLGNVDGLSALGTVGGHLYLSGNQKITNFNGLSKLAYVGGYLTISRNNKLSALGGLIDLQRVAGSLYMHDNGLLADCASLAPLLGWPSSNYVETEDDIPPGVDSVDGEISIWGNSDGCNGRSQILDAVAGPTRPEIIGHNIRGNELEISFIESSSVEGAIFPVTSYQASCQRELVSVRAPAPNQILDNVPITDELEVWWESSDTSLFDANVKVEVNITHSDPSDLQITLTSPKGTTLKLWDGGISGGEDLVGTFPETIDTVDDLTVFSEENLTGVWTLTVTDVDVGPIVREGVINQWGIAITENGVVTDSSAPPISFSGVGRGGSYNCTVAPVTKLGAVPASKNYQVLVPLEVPESPVIVRTGSDTNEVTVWFDARGDGGTDITGYEATCTDGTNTFTGTSTSSPITVSGLTNDVAYTCTVTATNSVGTSSASAATDPITPEDMTTGLPIWLLYQATQ